MVRLPLIPQTMKRARVFMGRNTLAMGRRRLLICGIMKKDCNIRLISKPGWKNRPDHHESVSTADRMARLVHRCVICPSVFPCRIEKLWVFLNDIGTEELAHLEIVSTIVHQLTRGLSVEEIEKSGLATVLCGSYRRNLSAGCRWYSI